MRQMGQIIIIKSIMIQLDIYVVDFDANYRRSN